MGQLLVVVCSLIISLRRPPPELIPDPLATGIGITVNGSGIGQRAAAAVHRDSGVGWSQASSSKLQA